MTCRRARWPRFKADALPFTRYGLIHGTLRHMGRDAVEQPGDPPRTYPAKVSLAQDWIAVNGKPERLQPGMRVETDAAMIGKPRNERKVCDAVARLLEARTGDVRKNARCPENDWIGPPVDYAFDLGSDHIAIEHTIIEAFDKQIHTDVDFLDFALPIQESLEQTMPKPGVYHLTFPIDPSAGLHRRRHAQIRAEIVDWVRSAAAELCAEAPVRLDRYRAPYGSNGRRETESAGISIALRREVHWALSGKFDGRLFLARVLQGDMATVQEGRLARMNAALVKKLPKLQDCRQAGCRIVLVLENRDIALTNHGVVGDTLEDAIRGRTDVPDEIILVDTTVEKEWTAWSIYREGVFWPDEETERRYVEFSQIELDDV